MLNRQDSETTDAVRIRKTDHAENTADCGTLHEHIYIYITNSLQAPGFVLLAGEILKRLPRTDFVKLTHVTNAAFKLKRVAILWKTAELIMIQNARKDLNWN